MVKLDLSNPEVKIREDRLNSILSYEGTAKKLYEKFNKCKMHCNDLTFNQCGDCSAQRAFNLVSSIKDAAVVNHAPIGCAADFSNFNEENRGGTQSRGYKSVNIRAISSNLQEKDTVYGGVEKLKSALKEAYIRFNPKAIFVTTSCASGVIGDDVESAINDIEEEIGIPIVPIYCEGFKSKIWTTGFDAALHGIIRKIVKPPKEKRNDLINIFNFSGKDVFTELLGKIGLKPNYLVPLSTVEQLEKMSEAAATAHICETLGTYAAKALEQEYDIPEVKAPTPYGFKWTDQWLREIGKITHKEIEVESLIKQERKKIKPKLDEVRNKLHGKKAYVLAGGAYAHNLISIAHDLELEIVGATSFHYDRHFDNDDERLNSLKNLVEYRGDINNYSVCNKQPYKAIKFLKKLKPDLLIVRHNDISILGTKLGIPTIMAGDANIEVGYDGVIETGLKLIQAIQTKNLIENISKHAKFPYTNWWYEQ